VADALIRAILQDRRFSPIFIGMTPDDQARDGKARGGTQRVRVGLIGLAWVFLLVAAATAFLRAADPADPVNATAENVADLPNDPLADLGVAPGNPSTDDSGDKPATDNRAAP
jgi:hypothetical protein